MKKLASLTGRNIKLYFRDKGLFFTSLVTPLILLLLYSTFLNSVFQDSFKSAFDEVHITVTDKLIEGLAAGQLVSSVLAVCCVTVAFCCNMLMVQDKITGARNDFSVCPVSSMTVGLSYFIATFISTLIINMIGLAAGLMYIRAKGWYLDAGDVRSLFIDILVLVLFGTALSSLVNFFLSTSGQVSAVGTIVSAGYGFICGAYMPISSFSKGLQDVLKYMPSTYGTSLMRRHALRGPLAELSDQGAPDALVTSLKKALDCRFKVSGSYIDEKTMYIVLVSTICFSVLIYILMNARTRKMR